MGEEKHSRERWVFTTTKDFTTTVFTMTRGPSRTCTSPRTASTTSKSRTASTTTDFTTTASTMTRARDRDSTTTSSRDSTTTKRTRLQPTSRQPALHPFRLLHDSQLDHHQLLLQLLPPQLLKTAS